MRRSVQQLWRGGIVFKDHTTKSFNKNLKPQKLFQRYRPIENVSFHTTANINSKFCNECKKNELMIYRKVFGVTTNVRSLSAEQSEGPENQLKVDYRNGFPVILVPLPSRKEKCLFTLKPVLTTVGKFIEDLKTEDKGIDRVAIYTEDNLRIASNTHMEPILQSNFQLQINDAMYTVLSPVKDLLHTDLASEAGEVRRLIARLYSQFNVEEHHLQREHELREKIESLNEQIRPLERHHRDIAAKAEKRTSYMMWGGLMYMSMQFGVLARLTWWEYSWDIMEPVTYFVTYGTTILMYGYFLLTKQEYVYPDARDRQYLISLHKAAEGSDFSIQKYNSLLDKLAQAERDLNSLKNPNEHIYQLRLKDEANLKK